MKEKQEETQKKKEEEKKYSFRDCKCLARKY